MPWYHHIFVWWPTAIDKTYNKYIFKDNWIGAVAWVKTQTPCVGSVYFTVLSFCLSPNEASLITHQWVLKSLNAKVLTVRFVFFLLSFTTRLSLHWLPALWLKASIWKPQLFETTDDHAQPERPQKIVKKKDVLSKQINLIVRYAIEKRWDFLPSGHVVREAPETDEWFLSWDNPWKFTQSLLQPWTWSS